MLALYHRQPPVNLGQPFVLLGGSERVAREDDLETWFFNRFRRLRETAFRDPESFFHRYSSMPEDEALGMATNAWTNINLRNLRENILPTRERARLILEEGPQHIVERVLLRRV